MVAGRNAARFDLADDPRPLPFIYDVQLSGGTNCIESGSFVVSCEFKFLPDRVEV